MYFYSTSCLSFFMQQQTRQLAAILFTDIVGSTAMMQKDEQHAVSINKRYIDILQQSVLSHGGEIVNDYGDGSLCIFSECNRSFTMLQLKCSNNFKLNQKFHCV